LLRPETKDLTDKRACGKDIPHLQLGVNSIMLLSGGIFDDFYRQSVVSNQQKVPDLAQGKGQSQGSERRTQNACRAQSAARTQRI